MYMYMHVDKENKVTVPASIYRDVPYACAEYSYY